MKSLFLFTLVIFIYSGCSEKELTKSNQNRLKNCVANIIMKNERLMKDPAVGNWKYLKNIKIELEDENIKITYYYKKEMFSKKSKEGLDIMQYTFAKQANCNRSEIFIYTDEYQ